ncbi:DUF6233 domain-containing protein [Streptomyces spectabilis]|uniref:Uncharacterized protein n=1 Tax=Streptomyces spectabilis TaxID=68270 RepID=A0A5P2X5I5_STRST|nr:DUF6233 domain-containing protein [Streptomyces spectabilis]MBB5108258.1 hypothetical protein [Streptomyces spectabilis]MCI3901019.1 DUF6233 domain-containing protein [Streptomyces spectabilis]QEV58519.1 hypothetical protein CP982_07195 [Streptomyces spectabilis]GGV45510.1 hypothetical protein GCM10010245_71190 [Streptomyces spectabilis]
MHDTAPESPRLTALRFLERVQVGDLERTRRWIAAEEQRETERARGAAARPPTPDWLLETGVGRDRLPVYVHVGGCHMAGKRSKGVDRGEALHKLAEGVEACPHCRPDKELGFLE